MKFVFNALTKCSGRLGQLCEIHRLPDINIETPCAMLYTKGGTIPHLTYEVLQMIFDGDRHGLLIPLQTTINSAEVVQQTGGIADFICMKDFFTYCCAQDPGSITPTGFNERGAVSIWSRSGNQMVSVDRYMDIMESFRPDMYEILSDGDTNKTSSKKRVQKSVDRTLEYLEKCVDRHKKSKVLHNSAILGVVEGGYNLKLREYSAKETAKFPVSGFLIDGLHNNGPNVDQMEFSEVKDIVMLTLKNLPEDKFRAVHGAWNPETVLDMIECGIDIFDCSFPYIVTERGSALTFPFSDGEKTDDVSSAPIIKENSECNLLEENKAEIHSASIDHGNKDTCLASNSSEAHSWGKKFEISLFNKQYFDDFNPISKSCNCLTCKNHTKAYIHHLLNTKELLGSVLLMIHNLHHYMEFFKTIRKTLKENSSVLSMKKYFSEEIR